MYVGCVANSNWKLWTKKLQHHFEITGNVTHVPIHAFALHSDTRFSKVLHEIWSIFPRSFDIVVISDIPTRYLIFCTKQTRKQSLFYWHPERHASAFIVPATWRVFVRKHWKVCCSLLQWSNVGTVVWCRTCTVRFFRSLLRLFSSFSPIWACGMKVLWKVASSHAEDLKPFFYIVSQVQREEFHYDKAISCKSYMQLLNQDVYSISSQTCQL